MEKKAFPRKFLTLKSHTFFFNNKTQMPTLKRLYLSELKLKCDVISSLEFILQFTRIVESNKKKTNFKYDVTVILHFISREKFRGGSNICNACTIFLSIDCDSCLRCAANYFYFSFDRFNIH